MLNDSITLNLVVKVTSDKYLEDGKLTMRSIKKFVEEGEYTKELILAWYTRNSTPTLILEEN